MLNYKHIVWLIFILLSACSKPWNNPYQSSEVFDNTLYSAFSSRPKHLDPAKSYAGNEWVFIQSVYETPLQYHYLKRPYELIPNILKTMPEIVYYNDKNEVIAKDDIKNISYSEYILDIKQNIKYQQHPAYLRNNVAKKSSKQ